MKNSFFCNITRGMIYASLLGVIACSTDTDTTDNNTNEAIDCIMTRYTVRSFAAKPISDDTVEVILKAGMSAPSAMNKQPWKFVAVQNEPLANLMDSMNYNAGKRNAALAIVVCGDSAKFIDGQGSDFWVQDCAAATENILLAAHALGLGAGWNGCYPALDRCEKVKNCLNLTDNLVPLSIVLVGYPEGVGEIKDKWNSDNIIMIK